MLYGWSREATANVQCGATRKRVADWAAALGEEDERRAARQYQLSSI